MERMFRVMVLLIGLATVGACNASTMAGFAEAAREDRLRRESTTAYADYQREKEINKMERELEEIRRSQRRMCREMGGVPMGSSCI